MQRFFNLLLPFLLSANLANAQLFVDTNYTVEQMVFGFFNNNGVSISNLNYTGAPAALAFFEGSQSNRFHEYQIQIRWNINVYAYQ